MAGKVNVSIDPIVMGWEECKQLQKQRICMLGKLPIHLYITVHRLSRRLRIGCYREQPRYVVPNTCHTIDETSQAQHCRILPGYRSLTPIVVFNAILL